MANVAKVSQGGPALAEIRGLPAMIQSAAARLAAAESPAQVLVAKEEAGFAYDAAKRAARLAKAMDAHAEIMTVARRAQADALEIEALAEVRIADEVDRGQADGIFCSRGRWSKANGLKPVHHLGLSRKDVFDARQLRSLIAKRPAALKTALQDIIDNGYEPTRAILRRTLREVRVNAHRKSADRQETFRLIGGRDIRHVSWLEISALKERAEAEIALLTMIEAHAGNVEPGTRIGDVIGDQVLADMVAASKGGDA